MTYKAKIDPEATLDGPLALQNSKAPLSFDDLPTWKRILILFMLVANVAVAGYVGIVATFFKFHISARYVFDGSNTDGQGARIAGC